MSNQFTRAAGAIAGLACLTATAGAVGNTPIRSESTAARSLATAFLIKDETRLSIESFNYETRNIVDRAFRQLNAVTTAAALVSAPGGVVVNCAVSGSFRARMANSWPRVVKFEWTNCVRDQFGAKLTLNGPGEVTLLTNTLAPKSVAVIRLGDGLRDLVRNALPPPDLPPGSLGQSTETRNLRLAGVLPLARDDEFSYFPGRFTYEVTGFVHYVAYYPDFSSGVPSAEYYPYTTTVTADHALITGLVTNTAAENTEEYRVLWGSFARTDQQPTTPNSPGYTSTVSFRGYDLRVFAGQVNDAAGHQVFSIDGTVEASFNSAYANGCRDPEVFTYRTRTLATAPVDSFFIYDAGEIDINGSATAKFTMTGTTPFVDTVGHIALKVRGVGNFNYDYQFSTVGAMYPAAFCTP